MQLKEILDQWSKNKEQVFWYSRYQDARYPTPCIVTGFTSRDKTDRYGRKTGTEKLIEVLMFPNYYDKSWDEESITYPIRPKGTATVVKGRYLSESYHESYEHYIQSEYASARASEKARAERETVEQELSKVLKDLCLNVYVSSGKYGSLIIEGSTDKMARLLATLRDAQTYYASLTTEEEVA